MRSNKKVTQICAHCGKEFEARTTVTKTRSEDSAKRAYKARQRLEKVEVSNKQTEKVKAKPIVPYGIRKHPSLLYDTGRDIRRIDSKLVNKKGSSSL